MSYRVTKYGQSCFLIEKEGHAIALDIGSYAVEGSGLQAERWPKLDAILLTHQHADHADRPTVAALQQKWGCPILTNSSFAAELVRAGIPAETVQPDEHRSVGAFEVHGVVQAHGDLPPDNRPGPECLGFVVDETFYSPGDSLPLDTMPPADVLFVPVTGPQMSFETARWMIEIVRPKLAIPMHFSNQAKFPLDLEAVKRFSVPGVAVRYLDDGQSFTWPPG